MSVFAAYVDLFDVNGRFLGQDMLGYEATDKNDAKQQALAALKRHRGSSKIVKIEPWKPYRA